jgi:hypothetical protein
MCSILSNLRRRIRLLDQVSFVVVGLILLDMNVNYKEI